MAVKPIPDGYHTVTPYLIADDLDAVVDFLVAAFDGTVQERLPDKNGRTAHADVRVGDSHVMLGSSQPQSPARPCMLYLYVEDTDAAYHRALAAGATSVQEPADMFYGDRNAAVQDTAGNYWWLATRTEELTPEELAARATTEMAAR